MKLESVTSLVEVGLYLIYNRTVTLQGNTTVKRNLQIITPTIAKCQLKFTSIALFFRQYYFV